VKSRSIVIVISIAAGECLKGGHFEVFLFVCIHALFCLSCVKPGAGSDLEHSKLVQLLPNYEVWVNKLNLQITVNEAPSRKAGAALYLLRRIIPLVFSWDELACSRGQGLNCKTTDDVFGRSPLDPTKVMACKGLSCLDC